MRYTSTRDDRLSVSSSHAIANGISREGGLFVPAEFPQVSMEWIAGLSRMSYAERAKAVLSLYLDDFTGEELESSVKGAYEGKNFEDDCPAPLSDLSDGRYLLELWHGPTCAFKDMALQLMPRLMSRASRRALGGKEILILVATSGDTGKAALEGFKDVFGVKIAVFYPAHGVSEMQKLQMATQEGENVEVFAIEGNFDDAQAEVKRIFSDQAVVQKLLEKNTVLSSANSINWGRLAPQIVYYFSAYADLLKEGDLKAGDPVNFVVPTGNFGNILAGYYAKKMGLPVGKLICASNQNNVLTDFFRTGTYDAKRPFYTTISPSMDILISSNLERLLFDLGGRDAGLTANLMASLKEDRSYRIPDAMRSELQKHFWAGCCDDAKTKEEIGRVFREYGYLADPHTAVALWVGGEYEKETGDRKKTVVVSTASPYKFTKSVLSALGERIPEDEFDAMKRLAVRTATLVPEQLSSLGGREVRFTKTVEKKEMAKAVLDWIG